MTTIHKKDDSLHPKKHQIEIPSDILNENDDIDTQNLSTREKISDFIADHDSAIGCAGLLLTGLFFAGVIYGCHEYFKTIETQQSTQDKLNQLETLEPIYIRTLLTLCDKMTDKNKEQVLKAVDNIVLIDFPNQTATITNLNQTMLTVYNECQNNMEFTNYLIHRLRKIENSGKTLIKRNDEALNNLIKTNNKQNIK